jgi:voltage-gated potassium channel
MHNFFFRSEIYRALLLLVLVLVLGVLGFMFFDDYTFVDAIFMTVITVSTVGFSIVDPLSPEGKMFTIFLIISSIGVYTYAATIITRFLVDGQFLVRYRYNQVYKKIRKMSNHVIVCGYGRNGQQAIQKLKDYKKDFVVIEKDKDKIDLLAQDTSIRFVQGDATEDDILIKAGVENSTVLITTLPKDSENLFVVLSAKQINKDLRIISRASDENTRSKLKIAGADNVIMPDKLGGDHMASLVVTPDVVEFLDNLSVEGIDTTNIKEVKIKDLSDEDHPTIKSFDLRRKTGVTVIGVKTNTGEYFVNPDADMVLEDNSKLIVLGKSSQIKQLNELYGVE